MGAIDWLAGKLGYARPRPRPQRANFAAAELSRLTSSLVAETEFINTTLRHQLRILRARSRQAAQNNPFARRFVQMCVDNIAGPVPFKLQAKVRFAKGNLDTSANRRIEQEWALWGKKGTCELSGRWSWNALQRLVVRNLATDGELLIRKHRGANYGRHGYRLQVLDVDRLDDQRNESLKGGGAIHMGVEVDANSKPVAYHILKRKPAMWGRGYDRDAERVPAADIVHVFVPEFAEQIRGVPWMYAALLNLVHLGAFEEAAVIAARIGAAQMGFLQSKDGGDSLVMDGKDTQGNPQIDATPGAFNTLPPGYEVAGWNPKYPDAAIEPFVKACLRGIAVGVNVAYHNLSGDMEGVNYSSARIAELDERDSWMTLQNFLAEHLHDEVYADWLNMCTVTGALPFVAEKIENYRAIYWQARRWAWVDPAKEVEAAERANKLRIRSLTRIALEQGDDIEDVFQEIKQEEELAESLGITLAAEQAAPASAPQPQGDDANA